MTGSGDVTPCRMTAVTLHGVVSPETSHSEILARQVFETLADARDVMLQKSTDDPHGDGFDTNYRVVG